MCVWSLAAFVFEMLARWFSHVHPSCPAPPSAAKSADKKAVSFGSVAAREFVRVVGGSGVPRYAAAARRRAESFPLAALP
jgi:hypothetical protein